MSVSQGQVETLTQLYSRAHPGGGLNRPGSGGGAGCSCLTNQLAREEPYGLLELPGEAEADEDMSAERIDVRHVDKRTDEILEGRKEQVGAILCLAGFLLMWIMGWLEGRFMAVVGLSLLVGGVGGLAHALVRRWAAGDFDRGT